MRLQLWGRAGDWRLPRGEFIGLALLDLLLELPLAVALVCSLAHVSIGRRPWSGRTVVGICSVVTVDKGTFHPFAAAVACAGWEGGRRGTTLHHISGLIFHPRCSFGTQRRLQHDGPEDARSIGIGRGRRHVR